MNWGYKITLVYITFVAGILFMVYKCTQQNIDLVSTNYYDQELKFSDQYNRQSNVEKSNYKLQFKYNEILKTLDIHYPPQLATKGITGEISFFKPDNAALDFKIKVTPVVGNIQQIPVEKLTKGFWKLKINWSVDTLPLYQEEKINLE